MRHVVFAVSGWLLLSTASFAAKPPGTSVPPNPQIAYRLLSGKSVKLMVANEDGTNATALYTSPQSFRFDLAPRGQRQIVLSHGTGASSKISLLTYAVAGSGTFQTTSIVDLAASRQGETVDFSPDGTKIIYKCCFDGTNETLAVYDLADGSITPWATGPYFWDYAWFRDGASIAYSTHGPARLYELTGPGAEPILLYSGQGEINVDSSRTNPNRLVVSYNDTSGNARIGFFEGAGFTNADIVNSVRAWQGTLNCDDSKLAYMGVQNTSGSQAFYIRELNTGVTSLVSKNSNITLQFWPTCS